MSNVGYNSKILFRQSTKDIVTEQDFDKWELNSTMKNFQTQYIIILKKITYSTEIHSILELVIPFFFFFEMLNIIKGQKCQITSFPS